MSLVRAVALCSAWVLMMALAGPAAALPRSIGWASPPGPGGPFAESSGVQFPSSNSSGDVCGARLEATNLLNNTVAAASSVNGSRVFFTTEDKLVSTDADTRRDIYEFSGGLTRLVSTGSGYPESSDAYLAGCSTDGSKVFFTVVAGFNFLDLFVRTNGTSTSQVNVSETGETGHASVASAAFSADGNTVVFDTREPLTADDVDDDVNSDVFERSGGDTKLVSVGGDADDHSGLAAISADGSRVYMNSRAQLTVTDTNAANDTYVSVNDGAPALVSVGAGGLASGGDGSYGSQYLDSTPDGSRVYFRTTTAIDPSDAGTDLDVYERNVGAATTTWMTEPAAGGTQGSFPDVVAVSPNGGLVYLASDGRLTADDTADSQYDIFLRTASGLRNVTQQVAGASGQTFYSCDELSVVRSCASLDRTRLFLSTPERLVAGDTDTSYDIYRFTAPDGPVELVSKLVSSGTPGQHFLGGVSENGARAFFDSPERLACRDASADDSDVYEWDSGALALLTPQFGAGLQGNVFTTMSADGGTAFFTSNARYAGSNADDPTLDLFAARPGGTDDGRCLPPVTPSQAKPQCSDARDNDGDGASDRADPGCLSGAGGTYNPLDADEADESVADLVLCGRRDISLIRADQKGRKVALSGVVAKRLAGKRVTLTVTYGGRTRSLATVKPAADGQFKATVARPPRRHLSRARYRAAVGKVRSVALKLPQSLASTSVRVRNGQVELRGQVKRSLLGKRRAIAIRRLVCGKLTKTATTRASRNGRYVARFKQPPFASAALYRAETRVLARPRSKRYVRQFARAVVITFADPTG